MSWLFSISVKINTLSLTSPKIYQNSIRHLECMDMQMFFISEGFTAWHMTSPTAIKKVESSSLWPWGFRFPTGPGLVSKPLVMSQILLTGSSFLFMEIKFLPVGFYSFYWVVLFFLMVNSFSYSSVLVLVSVTVAPFFCFLFFKSKLLYQWQRLHLVLKVSLLYFYLL